VVAGKLVKVSFKVHVPLPVEHDLDGLPAQAAAGFPRVHAARLPASEKFSEILKVMWTTNSKYLACLQYDSACEGERAGGADPTRTPPAPPRRLRSRPEGLAMECMGTRWMAVLGGLNSCGLEVPLPS
jgi:hypothetical protein